MKKNFIYLVFSFLIVCSCAPDIGDDEQSFSDKTLISLTLDDWLTYLNQESIDGALSLVDSSFLHQGRTKQDFGLWISDLMQFKGLTVELSHAGISINETADAAILDYIMTVKSCMPGKNANDYPDIECKTVLKCNATNSFECGWIRNLKKDSNGYWTIAGDDSEVGVGLYVGATSSGVSLVGGVYDPSTSITSAGVEWSDGSGAVELLQTSGSFWVVPTESLIPDGFYPGQPLPWNIKLSLTSGGNESEYTDSLVSVMDLFAANLLPNGEAAAPIEFSWLNPDEIIGGVEVHLYDDDDIVWKSDRTFEEKMIYAGPTLISGNTYEYHVVTYDLYGNYSIAQSNLVPLDSTDVSPRPLSIAPSTGSSLGGTEIIISGQNFLNGARVKIGTSECVDVMVSEPASITCITPALSASIYNIIVINPSGADGVLEDGFTVLE